MSVPGASLPIVEAVAWSLFGLMAAALATLVTAYWRLSARMEEIRTELAGRIDAVRTELGSRIDGVNTRLDAHIGAHAG